MGTSNRHGPLNRPHLYRSIGALVAGVGLILTVTTCLWVRAAERESKLPERPKAERMAEMARTLLAPVYPALAKQIVEDTGITEGIGIDLGCGSGELTIELVRLTKLKIYALDLNPYAVAIAQRRITEAKIGDRAYAIWGDALNLPFKDNWADLVVSRGLIPFLPDKAGVFREAWRVLKPGGVAYIGGGFTRMLTPELVQKIVEESWGSLARLPLRYIPANGLRWHLQAANIVNYRIIEDQYPSGIYGRWVMFRK